MTDNYSATVTVTSLIDAVPMTATPSNLPPLPTGSFLVPLINSSGLATSNDSCLTQSEQKNTWACFNGTDVNLELTSSNGHYQAQLVSKTSSHAPIHYGAQPPQLSQAADLILMYDKEDWNRGPAYFFQELYDKVVVIRELEFTSDKDKRWLLEGSDVLGPDTLGPRDSGDWNDSPVAVPADKPWFCFWNNTVMEGFIYITGSANSSTSTQSAESAAVSDQYSSASSIILSSAPSSGATAPSAAPSLHYRQAMDAPFSKVLKLEERRGPQRQQPYCQQMQIMNDGTASPITIPPSGNLNTVNLDEDEPVQQNRLSRPSSPPLQGRRRSNVERRRGVGGAFLASACQCQWLNE